MSIFLDYNATTPLAPSVIEAIKDGLENAWSNPSSGYKSGRKAKGKVEAARSQVASMISASSDEITFTSGGTESNHLAMHWALKSHEKWRKQNHDLDAVPHVVTTNIEHCATELPLKAWHDQGSLNVTFVPVDKSSGKVRVEDVMAAIIPNRTCLVTIMMANNETGVIQPVEEIFREVHKLNASSMKSNSKAFKILTHTDAAQAIGKVYVDVQDLGCDYLTIVGHKFYGPRIGAIYHRNGAPNMPPMFYGGFQERGLRCGTENTPMIIGLGEAANLVQKNLEADHITLKSLRDCFVSEIKNGGVEVDLNFGYTASRLPNTASLRFKDVDAGKLLAQCDGLIEASKAAACHTDGPGASSILIKSGLTVDQASSTIRFSVGRCTTKDEVIQAARIICSKVKNL